MAALEGGTADTADRAVVLILIKKTNFKSPFTWCSGVAVSPHVVITAGHCVDPTEIVAGATLSVFVGDSYVYGGAPPPSGSIFAIKESHVLPGFELATFMTNGHDLGVVITDEPLPVTPLAMNRAPLTSALVGQSARVVGFGDREAVNANTAGRRDSIMLPVAGVDANFVWEEGEAGATCEGDSGGATLVTLNGKDTLVGIHSATVGVPECTGANYDTRIDLYASSFVDPFIQTFDGPASGMDAGADGGGDNDGSVTSGGARTSSGGCSTSAGAAGTSWIYLAGFAALSILLRARRRGQH